MKLVSLRCPNCDANVNTEIKNQSTFFCPYCGSRIYVDDGVKRVEVSINQTYRKVEEARIRESDTKREIEFERLAHKERQDKRDNRMFGATMLGLAIFVLLLFGALFAMDISSTKKAEEMEAQGKVKIGTYYSDFEGEKYQAVVKELEARGFTNIETVDLDDAGWFTNKADTIKSISINGNTQFNSSDYFYLTDKIVITYH